MVFNVQDIWPDCLQIIGQIRNRALIQTFSYLEKLTYKVSSKVVVLSEGMKRNLLQKGVSDEKIIIIPNWVDTNHIYPVPQDNCFSAGYGLIGRFVVLFSGNLGFNAVLDTILEAAKHLDNEPQIIFLIVGEGNAKPGLIEKSKVLGLRNVRFLPTQTKELLPEMLGAANISLITLHRQLGALNVPSKVYAIMASARPVLAAVPKDSEIARLVETSKSGIWVPPEEPRALAQAIKTLSKQPDLLRKYGANGRNCVVAHYDRHKITQKYHELLEEVVSASQ